MRRKRRRRGSNTLGSVYKRGRVWWIAYCIGGKQYCESTHTSNRRLALQILALKQSEILRGKFHLPSANPPKFEVYVKGYLVTIVHPNTRRRYQSCINNLLKHFEGCKISEITAERIAAYQQSRLSAGVRAATINRDLAVLRHMLKIAERKRLIGDTPFRQVQFLEEREERRKPYIITFHVEDAIVTVADPHIRALTILVLETGLRSNREALALRWENVDLVNDIIHVRQSKTSAGEREVPISGRCKAELLRWHDFVGPEVSPWVFPNMNDPTKPLKDVRHAWAKALKAAQLEYFWIYDLRHTWASRMVQAGVSPVFVAQMLGHSSMSILNTYAKTIDEYRRDAVRKLEALRALQPNDSSSHHSQPTIQ